VITKWRSSYYFRLVLSYTVLALVLIGTTGGYLLSNANRMVMSEVSKDAKHGLLNVKDVVENNTLQVYEGAFLNRVLSIVNPQSAEAINYLVDEPATGNITKIVSFVRDLELITDMTKGMDGITVYFRTGQYVVDQRHYYETPDNSADAAFIRSLESVPIQHWFIREKPGNTLHKVMTYVYTLPDKLNPAKASGYLYLDINMDYLKQMVDNVLNFPDSHLYMFDEYGQLMLGKENASPEELETVNHLVKKSIQSKPTSTDVSSRFGNTVISLLSSSESPNRWTYVIVRPMESFLLSADKMKRQVWTASLTALLGGIIASFLLSSHFYMPLKKLLYSIRNLYTGPAQITKGTEYAAIDHMLMFIDLSMLKMKDQVRIKQITGLITGQQTAASFGELPTIPLECYYAVAYVVTEPDSGETLSRFIIEQSGLTAEVINLSTHELALLVFIYGHSEHTTDMIGRQLESMQHSADMMPFGVGIGSVVDSVDSIHRSYQEAQHAYKYSFVRGREAVIVYEDIAGYRDMLLYPDVSYDLFQNKVQAGNTSEAEQWIDHLAARLRSEPLSVEAIELICLRLGTVLSQVVYEQKLNDIFPVFSIHDRMKQCTVDDTLAVLKEHASEIAKHISESRNDIHLEKISRLKLFIEEHMADDLSLDELASRANLSSNYVSTLFGSITGESFTEYLNRIRLEHAAMLLVSETKLPVAEIATSVGYRNSQYFCTKFKAKFGITPLQYRNSEKMRESLAE
jgi:two-component system response regulator YesN